MRYVWLLPDILFISIMILGLLAVPASLVLMFAGAVPWLVTIGLCAVCSLFVAVAGMPEDGIFNNVAPRPPRPKPTFDGVSLTLAKAIIDNDATAARAVFDYLTEHPELLRGAD